MSPLAAGFNGLLRVLGSPGLVLWLYVVNFVVALPFAVVLSGSIESSIGGSLVRENLRSGFDMGWFGEYEAQARGIETTFRPSVVGVGAFLDNLEHWLNGSLFEEHAGIVGAGVLYALLWALFLGGILHRYTDGSGVFRLSEFLSQGGAFFFRFVRLAVLSGILYYFIYKLSGWLFSWIERATQDVTIEKTVLAYVAFGSIFIAFLLTLVNVAFDYAKIATFRENRRSMVLAALKGFGFVLANLGRTLTLYYGLSLMGLILLGLYWLVAPGAGQATVPSLVLAFAVGQAYLVGKLVVRLTFYAGQMSLYESVASGR